MFKVQKKVLYISPGYNPVENETIKYMAVRYGFDFVFVAERKNNSPIKIPGSNCYQLGLSGKRLSELAIWEMFILFGKLFKIICSRKYDIIISSTQHSLHSKFVFLICKLLHKEFYIRVETWYDFEKSYYMRLYHKIADRVVKGATGCLVHGIAARKYLIKKNIKPAKIKIFPFFTGDPLKKVRRKNHLKKEGVNLVFAGRLVKIKGIDILIKALPKVLNKYPNIRLSVIGKGPEKQNLVQLSDENGIDKYITFIGWLDHSSLLEEVYKHQIFVFPSVDYNGQKEGYGLSLVEAAGLGLPIISTDAVGASYDLIKNGFNGYIMRNNSIEELSKAIEKVIPYWRKMGENSRIMFEEYIASYSKVLQGITSPR